MEQQTDVDLDPMVVRLLAYVRRKGGPSEVSRRIGLKPSVFYNYEAGRNKQPSSEIMRLMTIHFEDFDPTYIFTGKEKPKPVPVESKDDVLTAENAGLKREIGRLEQTVSILQDMVAAQLGKELGSKNESANESTQGDQLIIDLPFKRRTEKRLIPIFMRDAFGISQKWSNL